MYWGIKSIRNISLSYHKSYDETQMKTIYNADTSKTGSTGGHRPP